MTQAPDAEQQRGHLEKLRTCLQRGEAAHALALLRLLRLSGLNDTESAQIIRSLSDHPSPDDFESALRWCEAHLQRLAPPPEASIFDDLDLLGDLDGLDDLVSMEDFGELEDVDGADMLQIDDIDEVGEDALDAFFELDNDDDDGGFFEHLNVADSQSEVDWRFDALDDAPPEGLGDALDEEHSGGGFGEHTRRIDPSAALAQLGIASPEDSGRALRDNFTEHTRQFDPAQLRALHTSPEASVPQVEEPASSEEPSFAGPNEPTGLSRSLATSEDQEPFEQRSMPPSIESFFDDFIAGDEPAPATGDEASDGYDFALGASLSVPFEESGEFDPEPAASSEHTAVVSSKDYDFAMGASISTPIEDLLNEISSPDAPPSQVESPAEEFIARGLREPSDDGLKFSFDEPSSGEDDFDLDFDFSPPGVGTPAPGDDESLDLNFEVPAPSGGPLFGPSADSSSSDFGARPGTEPAREPITAAHRGADLDFDFDLGPDATPAPPSSTPFEVADSVPGEVVAPEDDFFFPPPLNAGSSSAPAPLVEPEDDFFFPPPLNASASSNAAPGEVVEPEDDFFFPPPLNADASPASTAQGSEPARDRFSEERSLPEPSAARAEPPTARTPAPSPSAASTQERPTGRMPSLERTRERQDTPLAPQPNVAALKHAEATPPRGTTPIPFAADAPSSGVISTKRDHVDEEEFFALADSLASESSMSSLFELSDHHRAGAHYRGEPMVREVGDEPTPARVEPPAESSEPTNPFAHEAPTGVRNRPLSEMAASSFVLEEVDGPPSEIPDAGASIETITTQARRLYEKGEFETALEIVNDLLNQTDHAEARQLRSVLEGEMERIQQDRLGSLVQVPTLQVSMGDIAGLDLDHRAGFLLSQIDGMLCFEDILDMSSMSRLETLTLLADLFDKGIIGVDPH